MSSMSTSDLKLLFSLSKIVINVILVSVGVNVAGVFLSRIRILHLST